MMLTYKERMRRAIRHEPVDRLPTQINYTRAMGEKLAAHLAVRLEELPTRLDNHMIRVDITHCQKPSGNGRTAYDWWGVGFSTEEEGYLTTVNPLADSKDLDRFPWPDPYGPDLLAEAARVIEADMGDHFITCNLGFCLFERAWALRGFETFLMDLVLDPPFAEDLLERITAIQLVLIHRFIDLGVDGGYFGDDYGAQTSLLFSPRTWRRMIKPRLARMFQPFLEAGLPVIMHSDGTIGDILPDLVQIGLTVLNPVQPEVVGHDWLRQTFDQSLAYYGGISTQTVLPHGSPDDVRQTVLACAQTLAPDSTGLVLAPSHRMMTDIPQANVDALLEAFSDLGAGP
jgi:uroporphyrinogen decarboxylase